MVWDVEVGRSPLPASKTCTCFKNLPPGINQISVMLYCDCAAKYGYHLDFTHFHQLFWRRKWQLTPVFLPGESHGQRSLVGYSPWGHKGSDTTERLTLNEYSLEGLMLKLKLQYFGHLMQRADLFEKTLMLGKIEGRRRRGPQRMR